MFDKVPERYDLVNRVLTLGLDERWRRRTARLCLETAPLLVLDICCGTGDMTLHLAQLAVDNVEIIGIDFSQAMLDVARYKAEMRRLENRVSFKMGDVACLEYPDGHFDAVTVSFGFRNLTYRNPMRYKYLAEILRIIRPGGSLFIVETCQPKLAPIRQFYHFYLKRISSILGGLISGQRGAYRYLGQSAANYYNAREVRQMLTDAGFKHVDTKPLLWGIAAIYVATK